MIHKDLDNLHPEKSIRKRGFGVYIFSSFKILVNFFFDSFMHSVKYDHVHPSLLVRSALT